MEELVGLLCGFIILAGNGAAIAWRFPKSRQQQSSLVAGRGQ